LSFEDPATKLPQMNLPVANHSTSPTARFLAVEIGGTKLQIVAGQADGTILHRERLTVDRARGAEGIREQIATTLPQLISAWQPLAIGVGYGGPVNWRTGRIVKSYHVPGWHDFPLGSWLSELSGLPVYVENDGNVAALGEATFGAGRGCDPVFYVTVGSGVGGGLISENRIYHGFLPGETEVGHLRLGPNLEITEHFCSGWSIDRRIREAVAQHPNSELARLTAESPGNEARHLAAALKAGDTLASQLLSETTEKLALALSHVTHLCHPEVIVLGGGVSLLGEPFRRSVADHLQRMIMDAFQPGPRIALAALREDSVPAGALALAAQRFQTSLQPHWDSNQIMQTWLQGYVDAQHKALNSVPLDEVARLIETVRGAWLRDAQIFAIGNGGSAANASHFATDLGKGSSDKLPRRFRILSLTDNVAWMTALGNDYSYDDVFLRQMQNFARSGDVVITASVSGNSPNLVKAFEWANQNGLETVALVGAKRGKLAEISRQTIVIDDTHYGRVEDVQMHILHMLCYAFMERPELAKS
jgi:glucokinase